MLLIYKICILSLQRPLLFARANCLIFCRLVKLLCNVRLSSSCRQLDIRGVCENLGYMTAVRVSL